jgi:hypothetical protein
MRDGKDLELHPRIAGYCRVLPRSGIWGNSGCEVRSAEWGGSERFGPHKSAWDRLGPDKIFSPRKNGEEKWCRAKNAKGGEGERFGLSPSGRAPRFALPFGGENQRKWLISRIWIGENCSVLPPPPPPRLWRASWLWRLVRDCRSDGGSGSRCCGSGRDFYGPAIR